MDFLREEEKKMNSFWIRFNSNRSYGRRTAQARVTFDVYIIPFTMRYEAATFELNLLHIWTRTVSTELITMNLHIFF